MEAPDHLGRHPAKIAILEMAIKKWAGLLLEIPAPPNGYRTRQAHTKPRPARPFYNRRVAVALSPPPVERCHGLPLAAVLLGTMELRIGARIFAGGRVA